MNSSEWIDWLTTEVTVPRWLVLVLLMGWLICLAWLIAWSIVPRD